MEIKKKTLENLRDRGIQIDYPLSTKQWINALPPIAQAKLWNNTSIRKDVAKTTFKLDSKMEYQSEYALELYNNQEIYADYWKAKREEEQQNKTLTDLVRVAPDCNRSYCEDSFSGYSGSV